MNDPRKELINVIVTNILITAASQITTIVVGESYNFIKRKTAPPELEEEEETIEIEEETIEIEEEVVEEEPTKKKGAKKKKSLT